MQRVSAGLAVAGMLLALAPARAAQVDERFHLTERSSDPARVVALRYATTAARDLGLAAQDVVDTKVSDEVFTKHNRVTNVYLVQRYRGIEIVNAILNVAVDAEGRVIFAANRFVPGLPAKARGEVAAITREAAIAAAAAHVGLRLEGSPAQVRYVGGAADEAVYEASSVSMDPIPVRLKYFPTEAGTVQLAWDLVLYPENGRHWWNVFVDATNGQVLGKFDWVAHDSYDVFPTPLEDPSQGPQTTVMNPADAMASPFGWHDTNGAAGAEFTDTRGNNVSAQDDLDANNSGGTRPDGGASLNFNIAWNDAQEPNAGNNLNAAIVNLFYWNNVMHDLTWHYGFDSAGGNFQQNTYALGGLGNDAVQADAQDGSGNNNANFGTPPDGAPGRMQMFAWFAPPKFTVNTPAGIAGEYPVAGAGFGGRFDLVGMTNDIVLATDGVGASMTDACCPPEALPQNGICPNNAIPGLTGKIAIFDRGNCEFGAKALNVQNSGAVAAIIVNNQGDALLSPGPGVSGAGVTIPVIFIGQTNGTLIKNNLPVNATAQKSLPDRDSDFDNGIIAHEYGHGISNRLTGGPSVANCLQNQEQMGEGWSDFFALATTAKAGDMAADPQPIAAYVQFSSAGIRPFPYSTSMVTNPHTYSAITTAVLPHGLGSVWNAMLWEMYWNLVGAYGFDSNLYTGTGGNNRAIQLVIDGLKLQVCSPGFVDGRNAILAADRANTCGRDKCHIWRAFAKRGLGVTASQGSSASVADGTQAFDFPAECADGWIFNDGFESGSTCAWDIVSP